VEEPQKEILKLMLRRKISLVILLSKEITFPELNLLSLQRARLQNIKDKGISSFLEIRQVLEKEKG
jgi:hypothetical protein